MIEMQTPFAHPALWRGLLLFAGTLLGKSSGQVKPDIALPGVGNLVSWSPGARSRREDELERMRQAEPR